MKYLAILSAMSVFLLGCNQNQTTPAIQEIEVVSQEAPVASNKIQVLNFATFHMGNTSDATSVEFDETNKKNQEDARKIAELIAAFKPTVVCVEVPYEKDEALQLEYLSYLENPAVASTYYGEVGMVAFEVGRLSGLDRLYGIDHKLSYNYNINNDLENKIDPDTYDAFAANPFAELPELNPFAENLSLLDKLERMNHPKFLDFLIVANADALALVGTKEGFEGADEAAKYYQRNLRIYSNLNRIPLTKEDRVFILSGGSHTAFLNEFMRRSSKFEVVNTFDYLK